MSKTEHHAGEKTEKLQCQPLRSLHVIDRRDFIKDPQGNYLLDPKTGEPQLNWKCVCGKTSAAADAYRGGEFVFIYDDPPAKSAK